MISVTYMSYVYSIYYDIGAAIRIYACTHTRTSESRSKQVPNLIIHSRRKTLMLRQTRIVIPNGYVPYMRVDWDRAGLVKGEERYTVSNLYTHTL